MGCRTTKSVFFPGYQAVAHRYTTENVAEDGRESDSRATLYFIMWCVYVS